MEQQQFQQPVGYAANPQQIYPTMNKQFKIVNPMTANDLAVLKKDAPKAFDLTITDEQIAKAKCPHHDAQGNLLVVSEGESGVVRCRQCGETIELAEVGEHELNHAIHTITQVLQQIKLYGLTLPVEIFDEFMMQIELLKRVPKLYRAAMASFDEVQRAIQPVNTQMNQRGSDFSAITSVLQGTYAAPYANGGYQQPVYYAQQPVAQPQAFYTQPQPQFQGYAQPQYQQPVMNQAAALQNMQAQQPFAENVAPVAPTFTQPVNTPAPEMAAPQA